MRPTWIIVLLGLFLPAAGAAAQGVIIGPDARPAVLVLARHAVDAQIKEQVAVVTVTQEFHNPGGNAVEGTFLFPLPPEAQVSRFTLDIDGRDVAGELLPVEEAREIYEGIVRRSLDPALLEMADYRTFRARVFPIPGGGTRRITLRYDAALPKDGNTVRFTFPLQGTLMTQGAAFPPPRRPWPRREDGKPPQRPDAAQEGALTVEITTQAGLKNVYSPSHDVDVTQPTNRRARVRAALPAPLDGRDFVLYYSLDPSDVGTTLLAHRPYRDRAGYFMLLVSPQVERPSNGLPPQDVVFVLDTSGSMAGEKMDQARDALTYCLNRLGAQDRFGIVAFSSDVDAFRPVLSTTAARDDARYFARQLEARGGTNINAALLEAVRLLQDSERGLIVFLTDGLPSSGVTDEGEIRRNVQAANGRHLRLFSFGVGYDVNTRLLDGLSRETGAFADYISPDENIEERVSMFYDKVRDPVLTDLHFTLEGVDGHAYAPAALPDLYRGGQLILTGRYRRPGNGVLTLRGRLDGREQTLRYRLRFPDAERDQDFVARLWATRRVGHLLDEIRLRGEQAALKEEIVALAKEFGLVTPYTAYLVQEEETVAANRVGPGVPFGATRPMRGGRDAAAPEAALQATTGAHAVYLSKAIRGMQEADAAATAPGLLTIDGRTLRQDADGRWTDLAFSAGAETVSLQFASETYFRFLRLFPEARAFARLGDRVLFQFGGRFVAVGPEGDDLSEATLRTLFGRR